MQKQAFVIIFAFLSTISVLALGYISFGFWTTLIFTSGFLGGFVLWLLASTQPSWASIRVPYWVTLSLFLLHRVEENVSRFQEALSVITGVRVPEVTSLPLIMLVAASVGGWLLVPLLVGCGYAFGYYLAWTFFTAMGITELAHFVFPVFSKGPDIYFPGMASVVFLAPAAWWGMSRLSREST